MIRYYLLCLLIFISACQSQALPLPTLAVLPSLTPSPAPQQDLPFWEAVTGELAENQIDRWVFDAATGDPIRVTALGSVTMSLYGPDEQLITSGDSIDATLAEAGRYTVQVSGPAGRYQLGLAYTDRPNPLNFTVTPPPLTVGVPTPTPPFADLGVFVSALQNGASITHDFLERPVQPQVYTVEGRAGSYLTLRMTRISGTVDPLLRLFDPEGLELAVDDNSGGNRTALLRNIPLRVDGLYSVQVSGGGAAGEYELSLTLGDPVPVTPTIIVRPSATPLPATDAAVPPTAAPDSRLEAFVPVTGILAPGDVRRHALEASEGELISINVRRLEANSALRPVLELYGPSGELIGNAQSNTPTGDTQLGLRVGEAGVYSLFVTAEGNGSGPYVIAYGEGAYYENVGQGPAVADTPYDGHILRRGARDVWTLLLNAGDTLTVSASPLNAALDPVLALYAPDGSLIAGDDNSGGFPNALINQATAPVGGLYELYVSAATGATAGPYRLIWRYISIAPTPTHDAPRILLFTVDDEVQEGEYRFFPFQGIAGQRVRMQVIARPGTGLDPVAALIGPDGAVIAEGDDSSTDLNPQFSATLPSDGTYQLRVNGYLSSGAFEVIVERLF